MAASVAAESTVWTDLILRGPSEFAYIDFTLDLGVEYLVVKHDR